MKLDYELAVAIDELARETHPHPFDEKPTDPVKIVRNATDMLRNALAASKGPGVEA